jgi:threonine/homoserine/homoserine lactone efflux protein
VHIADLVLIGLAVTLEPVPITAFILVLSSERGSLKGAAFILGWLLSLVVVVAATVATTGGEPPQPSTKPSTAVLTVKVAIGVLLILLAFRQQRRPTRPPKQSSWMSNVDRLSLWVGVALGALLQPWVLVAGGAATIAQLHISSIESYFLLAGFCLLCTATPLAMELYAVSSPEAAAERLEGIRRWIDTHRDQSIVVLSLVVGFWLVGDSLYLIVS